MITGRPVTDFEKRDGLSIRLNRAPEWIKPLRIASYALGEM